MSGSVGYSRLLILGIIRVKAMWIVMIERVVQNA